MANASGVDELTGAGDGMTDFESRLLNLLGLLLVQERTQTGQISLLGHAGFRSAEIAALLGTTRNTVSVALSNQRRRRRPKQGRKAKK
ncbi:MAG: hypothetical protein QUV05_14765 [Phycisphaerae bacterium]|nr:hypothetical protein [Phycisphaerae bacterium]